MNGGREGSVSHGSEGEGIREDMFSRLVSTLYHGPGAGDFAVVDKDNSQSPFCKPQV